MTESLTLLFEKDPLQLTDADRLRIIEHFRADRTAFAVAEREAKRAGKANKHKADLGPAPTSIEDLGI